MEIWKINSLAIFVFLSLKYDNKNQLFYINILLLSFISLACSKHGNLNSKNSEASETSLPMMKPSEVKYPKVETSYINAKRASIDKFCQKYWKSDANNLSFLVAKNGEIIYERYQGVANRRTKENITKDTPLHIASVSKVLTATAVLLLIDKGKIDLDQKVNTILKNFPYPKITIKTYWVIGAV